MKQIELLVKARMDGQSLAVGTILSVAVLKRGSNWFTVILPNGRKFKFLRGQAKLLIDIRARANSEQLTKARERKVKKAERLARQRQERAERRLMRGVDQLTQN